MLHWYSPFPLPSWVVEILEQVDGQNEVSRGAPENAPIVFYCPPHHHFLDPELLLQGYEEIRNQPQDWKRWNIDRWLSLQPLRSVQEQFEAEGCVKQIITTPKPLEAIITLSMLRDNPTVLHAYLDLELQGELGRGGPDSAYLERLQQTIRTEALQADFISIKKAIQDGSDSSRAAMDRASELELELHRTLQICDNQEKMLKQVNEELEHYFAFGRQLEKLLEKHEIAEERTRMIVSTLASQFKKRKLS